MTSSSSSSPEIQPAPTADAQERFSYKHATHDEVLEDLSSRFLLNLPDEELSSLERICFQVEQAHWFYEDFVREQNPKFPSLPLKKFSEMLFHACPLLHQWSHDHEQAFNTFMQYKTRVPVCGAIMLNETWEKCILVKGWKSSSGWGFPKGKINEHEPSHECAVREVLEETGYNLAGQINPADVIEMSIKEQLISLFIVPGIPEDFPFKTRTRKEISRIEWFKLTDLPTWKRNRAAPGKFYLISPFIAPLKAFITARKPRAFESRNRKSVPYVSSSDRGAQESSSSSADTGEPQTPSPQYSKAVSVTNDHIITRHESDEEKGVLVEPLDPHFARLLNSLSISASKNVDTRPSLGINGASQLPKDSSPSSRLQTPDWSSRIPAFHQTPVDSPSLPRPKHISTQDSHCSQKHSNLMSSLDPEVASRVENGSGDISPVVAVANSNSPTSSGTTARKPYMSSRRSSSIADISPYLSRASEVPASGKRLKQLALLESVADESSKMTPTLISRELPPFQSPGYRLPGYPGPSASVPPPTSYGSQVNFRGSYESGGSVLSMHQARGANLASFHPFHESPVIEDPFQVRPRSSQFNHPTSTYPGGVYTRGSRNQNQSPSLLGGPVHVSPPANLLGRSLQTPLPQPFAPSHSTTPFHPAQPNTAHPIYSYASTLDHAATRTSPHSFHAHRDPYAVPLTHPVLPPQSRPSLPSSSVQLLSILNGDRTSGPHTSISHTGPPSTSISVHTP
ncbi:putative mrna-decapping enzyme subunit 2 [Chiua virens]|nr:putative mrna-decapping enzyme subunit 2 [Chiua virens]